MAISPNDIENTKIANDEVLPAGTGISNSMGSATPTGYKTTGMPIKPDEDGWTNNGGNNNEKPDETGWIEQKDKNKNKNKNKDYDLNIVPGAPDPSDPGQMNIVDYASQVAANPSLAFTKDDPKTAVNESMFLSDRNEQMDVKAGLIDGSDKKYQMDADKLDIQSQDVSTVKPTDANGYKGGVQETFKDVKNQDMNAAKGQLSNGAVINANEVPQADMKGIATGTNKDGSTNYLGKALDNYASQNFSRIIDTSTVAGRQLANQLGEGNYTDAKATLKGQLDILQSEFVDPATGEPKIPAWAAGTARNVSKIAAFSGMSGSAATAAMAQALMEASIPIAQADSQFFQTLTLQNLDNRQQSIINTANTLAKFEETNLDNRMAAAVQNSKAFLEMDMANLTNEQQERVINNQNRVNSILEDAKQENAKRLFVAESQNDLDKFYAQLNTQIKQYNSSQNLEAQKFNSTMEDSREKFYKEMQYNIDISNAKWRQEVELTEDQQQFQAATTDVKNMVDVSNAQLNQIWDRSDALLDYAWKSAENEAERKAKLAQIALAGDMEMDKATLEGLGLLAGTFIGSGAGQKFLGGIFDALF